MADDLDFNLVLGRVNAIDADVREIRSEMQQTVASVNSLRGAVDGMTGKLEQLISATGSIEGQKGMVPVSSIRWVIGTGVTVLGLMLTVSVIITSMILYQVDSRDAMVRKDIELMMATEKLAAKETQMRFRMSSHREASEYGSFE